MAIYRFEAKVISRTGGRGVVGSAAYRTGHCATSAAAYRAGAKMKDDRTGESFDYTRKGGVAGAEILIPEGAPAWMLDRERLWNAVEAVEKRKDSQLARDFVISLPHELTQEQRENLTRDFVREQFTARGYVADIAWHLPHEADGLNHHAHVMVPLRKVEGEGFASRKARPPEGEHPATAWKEELGRLREAWAGTANRHLEAAGLEERIDHRSLEARGINREPEPKQGPLATKIERQGRKSLAGEDRRAVKARNAEREQVRRELAEVTAEVAVLDAPRPAGLSEEPEEKKARALAEPGLDWTEHAGMVAQQDSAMKAFREKVLKEAPIAKPDARPTTEREAEATDVKAERLAKLKAMFNRKPKDDPDDGPDHDNSPGRGGRDRGGRTR